MVNRNVAITTVLLTFFASTSGRHPFVLTDVEREYATFSQDEIDYSRSKAREMFYFGWRNYLEYAYPADELDPIHCTGRGHDHANKDNVNINDVLGDYSLTLIDTLDSLVVFGDTDEFKRAVKMVIDNVSFEKNTTVQVFEATIRVIGGLLSAHMTASDSTNQLGKFYIEEYGGELLTLAHDLASRLLPAFEGTNTGLPYTRVNLQKGVLPGTTNVTCTAGAGSLLVEFGILSRLLGDNKYEKLARRANEKLWQLRDRNTGLHGNLVNIQTGEWLGHVAGLGAGIDSYYEYMLKAYVLFGEKSDLDKFNESYARILAYMRRGRTSCAASMGEPPIFVNVDSRDGSTSNTWIDSLQASFSGVLVLAGDVDEAVCHHALYYAIWKKYGVLPERFNWQLRAPDVKFYPLRPEFAESTYLLYTATKNPFYLHVGREILESLDTITRVKCGFATVHDVSDMSLEDRMESFFLSETMKYLYLLFDFDNPINRNQERFLFSTEGHVFPINEQLRLPLEYDANVPEPPCEDVEETYVPFLIPIREPAKRDSLTILGKRNATCETGSRFSTLAPPLQHIQMKELFDAVVGIESHSWI